MPQFEYEFIDATDAADFRARLNALGAEGWEAVSASADAGHLFAVLKRRAASAA